MERHLPYRIFDSSFCCAGSIYALNGEVDSLREGMTQICAQAQFDRRRSVFKRCKASNLRDIAHIVYCYYPCWASLQTFGLEVRKMIRLALPIWYRHFCLCSAEPEVIIIFSYETLQTVTRLFANGMISKELEPWLHKIFDNHTIRTSTSWTSVCLNS